MEKSVDVFAWTHKLECPTTICNDSVKRILHTGLIGFLFDDLADVILTAKETRTVRKNILLHQLRHGTPDKVTQCMENISQLNINEVDSKNQISKLEEEYEQQDSIVRQKVQKLRSISSEHSQVKTKVDLLKMKYDQTVTQLVDCNDMRLVCQHLMPSTSKNLDSKVLEEMLNLVTSLWTGANKRQVWETLSKNLDNIEIPTLWYHIYQNLADMDSLIKSEPMIPVDIDKKDINVDIAKLYGQHISMILQQLMYSTKATNHKQSVVEVIEKIEMASNNSVDISKWLILTLEVQKLETEQKSLQDEINKIQEDLYGNNTFAFDIAELISEIQSIDTEIAKYIQDIQQSLNLLKSAPTFIMKTREKICLELQKIEALHDDNYDSTWLNNDLCSELDIFYDILDLNALRKIMLRGDIGVYRHTKSCFSEAVVSVVNSQALNIMSYFPMVQTPIYSLIECYKNLVLMFIYKRLQSLEVEENPDVFQIPVLTWEENYNNTVESLNLSKTIHAKTKAEIDEFSDILNIWIHQTVQKVMEIIEKTVDDASFPDWLERYNYLLYMLETPT